MSSSRISSIPIVDRYVEEAREPAREVRRLRPMNRGVRLVGFWSAAIAAFITIAYAIVQPFTAPPAEWHGMAAYAASFNPITLSWLYPAFLLPLTFVVVMVSIHQATPEEDRLWTHLGVVFACLYATIEIVNYGLQLLAVSPSIQSGETEGLAFFAFTNPHGFFAALETLSYPLMLLALLFAAPVFRGSGLERWIRWTFLANLGVVLVLALIGVVLGLSLLTIGVITTDAWEVLFAMAMVLVAVSFHRAGERAVIGRGGQSSLRRNGGG
jgi:hypothetical protein